MPAICGIPFPSTKSLKKAFTTPREASGFIVRPETTPREEPVMRQRRGSNWTAKEAEWKADIERLDREARSSEGESFTGMRATSIAWS